MARKRYDGGLAVEPRHPSWFEPAADALAARVRDRARGGRIRPCPDGGARRAASLACATGAGTARRACTTATIPNPPCARWPRRSARAAPRGTQRLVIFDNTAHGLRHGECGTPPGPAGPAPRRLSVGTGRGPPCYAWPVPNLPEFRHACPAVALAFFALCAVLVLVLPACGGSGQVKKQINPPRASVQQLTALRTASGGWCCGCRTSATGRASSPAVSGKLTFGGQDAGAFDAAANMSIGPSPRTPSRPR
jgi:hypothetical protein